MTRCYAIVTRIHDDVCARAFLPHTDAHAATETHAYRIYASDAPIELPDLTSFFEIRAFVSTSDAREWCRQHALGVRG